MTPPSVINIQEACQILPSLCTREVGRGRRMLLAFPNSPPSKAMILPSPQWVRGQPSWPQKTVAERKAVILIKTVFLLLKVILL